MNFKIPFLAFFLGSLGMNAQSVDCQFTPVENTCDTGQYCVDIEVSSNDGADLLGSSSVRFNYDPEVLRFEGSSLDVINYGTYASINFDNDQSTLSAGCESVGGTPYSEHGYDGLVPGDFILTFVLIQPTIFGAPAACPSIDSGWEAVAQICFDVLDAEGDPNLTIEGTENGPVEDLTGTNFNDHFDPPTKYDNGSLGELHDSFNEICGDTPPPLPNTGPKLTKINASVFDDVEDFFMSFPGLGKTNLTELGVSFETVQVSPVPTKDILTVAYQGTTAENMTINIYDVTGKIILQQEYASDEGRNILSIDLSTQAVGMYLIQLTNGKEQITKNIVKE